MYIHEREKKDDKWNFKGNFKVNCSGYKQSAIMKSSLVASEISMRKSCTLSFMY